MALSTQDRTKFQAMLKDFYAGTRVVDMAERKNPFFSLIKKRPNVGGEVIPQPIAISNGSGGSGTIATAITNSQASEYKSFQVALVDDFVTAQISHKLIMTAKDANHAFDNAKREIKNKVTYAGQRLARQMFRGSGGAFGQIKDTTTIGSAVLILEDRGDVVGFYLGQTLVLGPNLDGSSIRTGTLLVTGVNRSAGEITMSGNITAGVAAAAVDDYVFCEGDATNALSGLASWLPDTEPTAGDSFFGVDRSVDSYLYGMIYDAAGLSVREAALAASAELQFQNGEPDVLLVSPLKFHTFALDVGAKATYEMKNSKGKAIVGFSSIELDCPAGRVKVISDINCPLNRGYLLTMDTWSLLSAGPAPMVNDLDTLMLRGATTNNYETRIQSYAQVCCDAPGKNSVIKFSD